MKPKKKMLKKSSSSSPKKGKIFVITGPSGSGKTSIRDGVLKKSKIFKKIITCTTRSMREGEKDGIDYHFFSKEKFLGLIKKKAFFENALVYGNYYGSLKKEVNAAINSGKNVLFTVDVVGALSIKKSYPKTITVFVKPPTMGDLEKRLAGRGTDSQEVIQKRLDVAKKEMCLMGKFDFIIVNDVLDDAIFEMLQIVKVRSKNTSKK